MKRATFVPFVALVLAACGDSQQIAQPEVEPPVNFAAAPPPGVPLAFVANSSSNTMSVIETATHTTVDPSPVTLDFVAQPRSVAITPDGALIYVTSRFSDKVEVIETDTDMSIAVDITNPGEVEITPDGLFAWVAQPNDNIIHVIDPDADPPKVASKKFAPGFGPGGMAFTPDGTLAYVTNPIGTVSVVETDGLTLGPTVPVGADPRGVAITRDGAFAYVANFSSNTVSVIETDPDGPGPLEPAVIKTVGVGSGPQQVAITQDGAFAYVTNTGSHTVSVIETQNNTVTKNVPLPTGAGPRGVATTADGAFVYVTHSSSSKVSVIETAGNTVAVPVQVGNSPFDVAIVPFSAPPTADAGGPYGGPCSAEDDGPLFEGVPVTFDGSASSDPDLSPLKYDWDFGDGGTASSTPTPTHTYADNGCYQVTLTVTDPSGLSAEDVSNVTVDNSAPTVDVGPDATIVAGGSFDLKANFQDLGINDHTWHFKIDWADGTTDEGDTDDQSAPITGSHQYLIPGEFTVKLTVIDNFPSSGSDQLKLTVIPAPSPPTADADGPYDGVEGSPVTFDGSGSSDPNGDPLTYHWEFGDGEMATSSTPTTMHTYADNPVPPDLPYNVTLTVTDPSMASDQAGTTATIANVNPVPDAGPDATIFAGDFFFLDGTFTDAGINDDPWDYTIDWADGTTESGSTDDQSAPITGSHQYFAPGPYTVKVTVIDKDEGDGIGALELTVRRPPTICIPFADCTLRANELAETDPELSSVLEPVIDRFQLAAAELSEPSPDLNLALTWMQEGVEIMVKLVEDDVDSRDTELALTQLSFDVTDGAARPLAVFRIGDAIIAQGDLVAVVAAAEAREDKEHIDKAVGLLREGDGLRDEGKYDDAIDKYRDAIDEAEEFLKKLIEDQF